MKTFVQFLESKGMLNFMKNPQEGIKKQKGGYFNIDDEYFTYFMTYYRNCNSTQKKQLYQRIYKAVMQALDVLKKSSEI